MIARNDTTLYYIHDPMCSWCWAFRSVWMQLQQQLPAALSITYLLGGLAEDSDLPMPLSIQQDIQRHWRTIEKRVPGTRFNFDFWQQCQARRSTYPACRALIAARQQGAAYESAMLLAIQKAYYCDARNPSDDTVLIDLAAHVALDVDQFRLALNAEKTQTCLLQEINLAQDMAAVSFPSLILSVGGVFHAIRVDYNHVKPMLKAMMAVLGGDDGIE